MHLIVIGLNHRTAPINIREKFSLSKDDIRRKLLERNSFEAVLLSTCNRTELYALVDAANVHKAAHELVDHDCPTERCVCVEQLKRAFFDCADEYLYTFYGVDCIRHLFEVAASLDSLVLGEGQILSQVKEAYSIAKELGATGTVLNTLFNRAIAVGKRVRTETRIAYNSVSVSYAAVELASKKLNGLVGRKALIFGAGKMAELTAQHLLSHGVKKILVANRHLERAEELALRIGGEAIPWEDAQRRAIDVDVIVTSTGAPHYVIKHRSMNRLMTWRNGRKIFVIDIAVPRDVEPEVGLIDGVTLYNIDDLEAVVDEHFKQRREEAEQARAIIDEATAELVERYKYMPFQPLMATLSERAEEVRLREIRRASSKLTALTIEEQRVIDNMTKMIVRKLLRLPMMNLNSSAGTPNEKFYADAVKGLFNLDDGGLQYEQQH
ncbi:MAG: glutamyl-tRNA reductase [Selenomonadaceae bacterium]|nr:glutamyl-tRNA reductase [Selenomonadaceae bacterium]